MAWLNKLADRVRNSRGMAHQRRYVEPRATRGRWRAWPFLSLPMGLLLTFAVARMLYLEAWPALVLLILVFWPVWAIISLPHYAAWKAHRRDERDRQSSE